VNCKSCNTRIPERARACPACGKSVQRSEFRDDPGSSRDESTSARLGPLSPSSLAPEAKAAAKPAKNDPEPDVEEVELDQEVSPMSDPVSARRRAAAKAQTARSGQPRRRPAPQRSAAPAPTEQGPVFGLEPGQLRDLLAEQPELVESGLSLYAEDGRDGVGFPTDVGEIDVLATDADDVLVVIMVSDPEADTDHVAELLHRVGWATKHLADKDQEVRGILLSERVDERTTYAAAAVRDTIDVKVYRVALTFDDAEL